MVCTPLGKSPNYCPRCRLCCIRCMQHPKLNSKLRKWVSGPWCRKPKRLAYCCQPLRLCWQRRRHTSEVTWAKGKSGAEDILLSTQSDTEGFFGRLGKAREFSKRAVGSALDSKRQYPAA